MLLLLSVSFQFLFFVLFYVFFLIATPYYDTKSLLVNCRLALLGNVIWSINMFLLLLLLFLRSLGTLILHPPPSPSIALLRIALLRYYYASLVSWIVWMRIPFFIIEPWYLSDIHDYSRVVRIHRFSQFFSSLFSSPFLFRTGERSLIPSPSSSPERRLISEPTRGLDKLHGNQKPKLSVPRGPRLAPLPPCFFDPRSTRTNPLVTFHLDRSRANQPLIIHLT